MKLLVCAYSRLSFSRGKQSTFRDSTKMVSTQNEVWETSAEIRPYWWPVTTQIWVVLLIGWTYISTSQFKIASTKPTILDKNVKKNARCMFHFRILPPKARFTQDTRPSPPKKQCWSVARTFLLPTKQHWPGRGGGRGHHGAKFAG